MDMDVEMIMNTLSLSLQVSVLVVCSLVLLKNFSLQKKYKILQESSYRQESSNQFTIISYLQEVNAKLNRIQHVATMPTKPKNDDRVEDLHYNFAKKILATGGSIDEVVSDCSITHGEAQLLSALHDKQV